MANRVVKPPPVCVCVRLCEKCKTIFLSASISVLLLLLEQGRRIFSLPVLSSVLARGIGFGVKAVCPMLHILGCARVLECVSVYIYFLLRALWVETPVGAQGSKIDPYN